MRILEAAALGAVFLAGIAIDQTAEAATYQFVDVTFSDGGTAVGTFDYDSTTGFTNVGITTSSNGPFPGALYTASGLAGDSYFASAPSSALFLVFPEDCLGTTLSTCVIERGFESLDGFDPVLQGLATGSVALVPVPLPAVLFATGLAGVAGLSRRRQKKIEEASTFSQARPEPTRSSA